MIGQCPRRAGKRILAGIVTLMMLGVTLSGFATEVGNYSLNYVNNPDALERLILRETASSGGAVLGKFFNGTTVQMRSSTGEYSRVRVGSIDGYMMTSYLTNVRVEAPHVQFATVNLDGADAFVNLRASVDEGATALARFRNGDVLQILGESGDFYHVRSYTLEGYMKKQFLLLDGDIDREPVAQLTWGKVISADEVKVYCVPELTAPTIGSLMNDAYVWIVGTAGPWFIVEIDPPGYGPSDTVITEETAFPDPQIGFVMSGTLQLGNSDPVSGRTNSRTYAVVNMPNPGDRLILRQAAGRGAKPLGQYFTATQVEIIDDSYQQEEKPDWVHVRVGGQEGYMQSEHLMYVIQEVPADM